MAKLYHAAVTAEGIHTYNHLGLVGGTYDTRGTWSLLSRENLASDAYHGFIVEANKEGNRQAGAFN